MSFFTSKLSKAEAVVARLASVLTVLGFDAETITAEDAQAALQARVDQAVVDARAVLVGQLDAAKAALAATELQAAAIARVFASAGIVIDAKAMGDEKALRAAIDTRVAASAAKVIAGSGHDPLPVAKGEDTAETIDDLARQVQAERDPVRKGRLVTKLRALRAAAGQGAN